MNRSVFFGSFVLLYVLVQSLSGATFEILFPFEGFPGERSVHVSDDGTVVVEVGFHPRYIWQESKGIVYQSARYDDIAFTGISGDGRTILSIKVPTTLSTVDASFDGSVLAGHQNRGNDYLTVEAVRVINGQLFSLGTLRSDDTGSRAWAVSADGRTIVGESYAHKRFGADYSIYRMDAFRWTNDTGMISLATIPEALLTRANDVSGDGSVIVGWTQLRNREEHAFRWTESTGTQSLGDLPGGLVASNALAVSANGSVVVGYGYGTEETEAFFWTERQGMQNLREMLINEYQLDLQNYRLRNATGVSADGSVIVGWGTGLGQTFFWRVNLIPEPSVIVFLASVVVTISFTRKRGSNRLS